MKTMVLKIEMNISGIYTEKNLLGALHTFQKSENMNSFPKNFEIFPLDSFI